MPDATCSVGGCDRTDLTKGLCWKHYQRLRRTGTTDAKRHTQEPPEVRFWFFVEKAPTGCWEWTGHRMQNGYGQFKGTQGTVPAVLAHRWSYEHHVGPIPDGLVIDHLCRNRGCVNPDHLEPVTNAENLRRGTPSPSAINACKTHCIRGHEFTPENTITTRRAGRSGRECRTCRCERRRKL